MKPLLTSAAYRIAFLSALAFALATAMLGFAVYYAAHAAFVRQMDSGIAQATDGLLAEVRDDGFKGLREAIAQREAGGPDALAYALFTPDGRRVAGQLDTTMPPVGWHRIVFHDPVEGSDPARAQVTALPLGHRLVVAADLEPLERIDQMILGQFAAALVALVVIGAAGGLMLGAYLRSRLRRIDETARAIISGDLSRRAGVGPRGDEFDRVAMSLNTMLDRIEALVLNLRQVTGDLAHDLRTPLTRLRQQLERLSTATDQSQSMAAADAAMERCDDVLRLFDAILRISELEEGSLKRHFSCVDLGLLADELADAHREIVDDAGKTLMLDVAPACFVTGDRELLAQAVINLIQNALKYSRDAARIKLGACCEGEHARLFVADDGPGIAPQDRGRATERFVRLEAARSTPGNGLGLSLARAIAEAHGGTLELADSRPGLRVTLILPRLEAA